MSALPGRATRADGPSVLVQARISPDIRDEIFEAAARSGVSIAYYLETLLGQVIEADGRLPVVRSPRPQREELPIPAA